MTVINAIYQFSIAVPSIILATNTLTSAVNGVVKIDNSRIKQIVSWIIAVLAGVASVYAGQIEFGLGGILEYVGGALTGIVAGGAANKLYDWEKFGKLFWAIEAILKKKRAIEVTEENNPYK